LDTFVANWPAEFGKIGRRKLWALYVRVNKPALGVLKRPAPQKNAGCVARRQTWQTTLSQVNWPQATEANLNLQRRAKAKTCTASSQQIVRATQWD